MPCIYGIYMAHTKRAREHDFNGNRRRTRLPRFMRRKGSSRRIESCYHCNVNTDSRSGAHSGRVVSYARYAIKRRAGISRGMNIDEHMSIHAVTN